MAYASMQRLTVAVLALAALAGCDEMGLAPGAKPGAVAATTGEAKPALRLGGNRNKDVEAPDVFSTTEEALWDGRPSLGGVWVASSDVVNPERVLMKNPKTGKSVTGALFRRERENPGPKLQLSSDAATALGLLAGQPGTISVVALRRAEEVAPEPEAEIASAEAAAPESTDEPADVAAAEPAKAETKAIGAAAVAAIGKAETPAETAEAAAEVPAPAAPKKPGFFGRLFKPAAPKAAAAVAAEDGAEPVEAPLSAINPEAVNTATLPDPAARPAAGTPAAAERQVHTAIIGSFGVEGNAKAAANKLGDAGFAAGITPGKSGGKAIWTVTAKGAGDKAAFLKLLKDMGFADAYVKG